MSARLPPLCHARDASFWRQRILKEQRAGDSKPVAYSPRESFSPRLSTPIVSHTVLSPRAVLQPFTPRLNVDGADMPAAMMWRPTPTLMPLPPRSPQLQHALQQGWAEPPLIMSKGFAEPPRVFRKYLEASTHSVHKPPVPVLHWKN